MGINYLTAQPYGCTGSGYPLIPNPGTASVAIWPGGVFNATNFVAAMDGDFRTNWSATIDPGITLNAFPFGPGSAPSEENALGQWIDEGIRYMFYGNGGGAVLSFPIAQKLSHAASCVSECVVLNWPVIPPHGCVSGQPNNTIGDLIILLGPPGTCWSLGAVQENIAVGAWPTAEEAVIAGYWGFIAEDGGSNSSHFLSITSCLKGTSHVMGVGVRFGGVTSLTVHHVWDVTGSGGTDACWQGNSACPYGTLPLELAYFGFMPSYQDDECGDIETGWGVAQSLDAHYVAIERALDNGYFEEIGRVYTNGDHADLRHYSFLDSDVPNNVSVVYYQLRMVDFDESVKFSDVIVKHRDDCNHNTLSVYPNPMLDHIYITGLNEGDTYKMFNVLGECIASGKCLDTGYPIEVNTTYLPSGGTYFVQTELGVMKVIKHNSSY